MKEICDKGSIDGRKTNHSLRVTGVSHLFQAGVPEKLIQQRSGHLSSDGLRQYQRTTISQDEAVSKVLTSGSTYQQSMAIEMHAVSRSPPPPPVNQMSFSGCTVTIYNGSTPRPN